MNFKLKLYSIVITIIAIVSISLNVFANKKNKNRNYLKQKLEQRTRVAKESLVEKYLFGKNGIEIGSYWRNDFRLYQHGAYLNVDFQLPAWLEKEKSRSTFTTGEAVNVVASGDNLPFKDNTFDYVFNSHVMEHFFDPIKTIKEHLRVIKKGGYLVYIIPHVDVIFDKGRNITTAQELIDRHNGKLKISDYYMINRKWDGKSNNGCEFNQYDTGMTVYSVLRSKIDSSTGDYFVNNVGNRIPKKELKVFTKDNHHHWNVWRPQDFVELAKHIGLNVVEYKERDDNVGNGFVVVIKK